MKKIIKLTESDLTNIVKRVIRENEIKSNKNDAVRASMVDHLTRYLFEPTAKLIGSVEVFKKIFGDTPEEFLQSFNNLEKVLYKKDNPNFYFLFADNGAGVVMIQIYPSGYVSASIQPKIIIEPLHYVYKVSYPDIPKLIIPWLENSYGVLVDDLQTSKVTNREDI